MVIKLDGIKEPLNQQSFHDAVRSFISETRGLLPSYVILHPEDEHYFVRNLLEKGYNYEYHQLQPISDRNDGAVAGAITYRNVRFIRSYDVEKGNIILAGS